ncbi:hypothetical protein GCM10027597_47000 [Saccharopolyspora tripterygii]
MQGDRAEHLRREHVGELGARGLRQRRRLADTGGVHHAGQVRDPVEQRGDGVAVGDVAGDDLHARPEVLQLLDQLRRARRLGAPAAGEHEPLDPAPREPARGFGAERPGSAGDQHGPAPGVGVRQGVHGAVHEPPAEQSGGAQRDLVLGAVATDAGEHRDEPLRRALVEHLRQVDQPGPVLGVFQRGDPAEPPDGSLGEGGDLVGGTGAHGTARGGPQWSVQGSDECECESETHRERGVFGARPLVEGDQRHGAVAVGKPLGQHRRVEARLVQHHRRDLRARRAQRRPHPLHELVVGTVGGQQQPGAFQRRSSGGAQRRPQDPVAPGVESRLVLVALAPGRQRGDQGVQLRAVVEVERQHRGQFGGVSALDRRPQPRVRRIRLPVGGGCGGGHRPVVLVPERVGGQVDPAGAGEVRGPVHAHAVDVQPGERGDQSRGFVAVLAQQRDALVDQCGQGAAGTDLQERRDARVAQRGHVVGEAHGVPDVPHPVLRRGHVTGDHERDLRFAERQPLHDRPEVLQHRIHQRRVERVRDLEPLGFPALRELQHLVLDT